MMYFIIDIFYFVTLKDKNCHFLEKISSVIHHNTYCGL
uniref:Uncharacterized protein n=1 Tax=Lepeophtheirus salmonis TaxID=72036 RepID=A0A0K2UWF9_LEPSM